MLKINARAAAAAWDGYVAKCDSIFGAPCHKIAAPLSDLDYPKEQLLLALKLLLAGAYASESFEVFKKTFLQWVKYLPHYVADTAECERLNAAWALRTAGQLSDSAMADELDAFLRRSNEAVLPLQVECDDFLTRLQRIDRKDPLIFHKACILLKVEYDEPPLHLGRMILKALFP